MRTKFTNGTPKVGVPLVILWKQGNNFFLGFSQRVTYALDFIFSVALVISWKGILFKESKELSLFLFGL